MELCVFHDRIYGIYETQLYVFEPTWDSFRPIERVGWDGQKYSIVDSKFKTDLFSDFYGYETSEQKQLCKRLIEETELEGASEITDSVVFWKWSGEVEAKWFKDRPCVFSSPCVDKNWVKYLKYLNIRPRTLRNYPRVRTKRLLRKR
jgi:hypothetical protein